MPRSYSAVRVHLVFSTKDRRPFLVDPEFRADMQEYLGGISKTLGCQPIIVGGVEDHVHVLAVLGKTTSQSDWVKELMRVSSVWAKSRNSEFAWQGGYGAFSVTQRDTERVNRYIQTQEAHHRKKSFQEEFLELLEEHGVEWEAQYLWE